MKFINEHIKSNEFKSVYLIYGEEEYLKKQSRDKLKVAIIGDDTMNYSYYEGKKIDIKGLISTGDTMPFFAERRLIIVENSGFFKSASDDIVDFIKNLPDYLNLIFIETEVDKRNRLYKAVNEKGYVAEMKFQEVSVLSRWIAGLLRDEQKTMNRVALELFITKTGTQMDNIKCELEKLICYTMNRDEITSEDVEAVSTTQTTSKIFDMITAIATKNQKQALDLYYDLLLLKEPPMRIMYLVIRQFNMMLQVKELVIERYDNANIGKKLGVANFLVGKYIAQSKSFSFKEIKGALEEFATTEHAVKSGRLDDKTGVELVIIKYSEKKSSVK